VPAAVVSPAGPPPPDPAEERRVADLIRRTTGSEHKPFQIWISETVRAAQWHHPNAPREDHSLRDFAAYRAMRAFKPADEIEAMIAAQAVGLHAAIMECLSDAMVPGQITPHVMAFRKSAVAPDWRTTLPLAQSSPRCGARTRSGTPCRSPAMPNGRCRIHGGTSTGPRTAEGIERIRKARTKHGRYTAKAIAHRRMVRELVRAARASCQGDRMTDEAENAAEPSAVEVALHLLREIAEDSGVRPSQRMKARRYLGRLKQLAESEAQPELQST